MAKNPKEVSYWPLGALSYAAEIQECYPDEAQALGVISILWNRQELALRRLFLQIVASKRPKYAEAIWDRQATHQARRDLLALSLHTVKLTKRQRFVLSYVIDKTKVMADRRNELLHAEYVVQHGTERLHARVKAPRSNKPPKHQPASAEHLEKVVEDLEQLVTITDGIWLEFLTRKGRETQKSLERFAKSLRLSQENPQTD